MGYREKVLLDRPSAFWPMDDDASLGIMREATGKSLDGQYVGNIFDQAIPLVSDGVHGTKLLDNTAQIFFPLPGASGTYPDWSNSRIWSRGRESNPFSIELYVKTSESSQFIFSPIVLFGGVESFAPFGIYLQDNKIYFKPDPNKDVYVFTRVVDWARRYHIVATYSQSGISLTVNGEVSAAAQFADYDEEFEFTVSNSSMFCQGSFNSFVILDAVAVYEYALDQTRCFNHYNLSRKTIDNEMFYSSNSFVYYVPDNSESVKAFEFFNEWDDFSLTNIVISDNRLTLNRILDQEINDASVPLFETVDGKGSINLSGNRYFDISNVTSMISDGMIIGYSFYYNPESPEIGLMSLSDIGGGVFYDIYTDESGQVVVNNNGSETLSGRIPEEGWNEIVLFNRVSGVEVYLNQEICASSIFTMNIVSTCTIGLSNGLYLNGNAAWIYIKSNAKYDDSEIFETYGQNGNFTLKMQSNLKWSQLGSATGVIFVPPGNYDGSLAFYNSISQNVLIQYNNGAFWPQRSSLPTLISNPEFQENVYNIEITLFTEDSEDDIPVLLNMGLYVYADGLKRIVAENNEQSAIMEGLDNIVIFDDSLSVLDRLDKSGVSLGAATTLAFPSQNKNVNLLGQSGTRTISAFIKLNQPVFEGDTLIYVDSEIPKTVVWNGNSWQLDGFSEMYLNGSTSYSNAAIYADWFHIVLISTDQIDENVNIYIGSSGSMTPQLMMNVGMFAMAPYELRPQEVENEYKTFIGFPKEEIATEQTQIQFVDYGLSSYRVFWQTA